MNTNGANFMYTINVKQENSIFNTVFDSEFKYFAVGRTMESFIMSEFT